MKYKIKSLANSLVILAGLMIIALLVLVLSRQFHFNDSSYPDKFGIYYSALKGLPSYFNPLWQTFLFMEGVALLIMPVLLLILRKRLKLPVMPWMITLATSLLGLLLLSSLIRNAYPFDDTVDSTLPWFTYIELVILASVLVGQYFYYYYLGNKESKA
jgi:hypothetical protein